MRPDFPVTIEEVATKMLGKNEEKKKKKNPISEDLLPRRKIEESRDMGHIPVFLGTLIGLFEDHAVGHRRCLLRLGLRRP